MVDLMERLDALLEQECHSYKTEDYLCPDYQDRLQLHNLDENDTLCSAFASFSSCTSASGINEIWREKICEWSYQVTDHFNFSREIVGISIHYLDRYLSTRQVNKKLFQLAAMTTLYLAIKLYEPDRVSMKSMIDLSRGYFLVEQMEEMELSILRALSWKVHPPTAYCFCKHVLFLLPYSSVPMDARHDVLELARFLTELSVIDYFFVLHRPSVVALAAVSSAMATTPGVPESAIGELYDELRRVPDLEPETPEVQECRERLRLLYVQGGYSRPARSETISPVCVSYGVNPRAEPNPAGLPEKRAHNQETVFTFEEFDESDQQGVGLGDN